MFHFLVMKFRILSNCNFSPTNSPSLTNIIEFICNEKIIKGTDLQKVFFLNICSTSNQNYFLHKFYSEKKRPSSLADRNQFKILRFGVNSTGVISVQHISHYHTDEKYMIVHKLTSIQQALDEANIYSKLRQIFAFPYNNEIFALIICLNNLLSYLLNRN